MKKPKTKDMIEFEIMKEQWGNGPWNQEPDEEEFEYKGYNCLLRRSPWGVWCGYIHIKLPSKIYKGEEEDSYDFDVHGGITLAQTWETNDGKILSLGFDCGHFSDKKPIDILSYTDFIIKNIDDAFIKKKLLDNNSKIKEMYENRTYRTIDFARNECKKLVDQIIEHEK